MSNDVKGFLYARGQRLVNGEGKEILLRGVGLGGWLLPEGYMWCLPSPWDRPRRIERMIEDLIGREKAEQFWNIYFERFITEADIRRIALEGFNSIRVPVNSRLIINENSPTGYSEYHIGLIDRVIEWCRMYGIYVILDLHGAPGGQTGTNIDDSENDKPELFINERNKRRMIDLWKTLAVRYKDEWIVAGYDLLNEPLPEWFSQYNSQLLPLYRETAKAIRETGDRHLIILEGAHWATDWSVFTEKFDDNLMLQFHKYWNNPDVESIKAYIDKREALNVPIFMGEGGENNKDWYAGTFRLFEDHNISWNFWTWKKMNTDNSPCSVKMPSGWGQLTAYAENGAELDKKTASKAENILWEFLDNISFDNCIYHPEVVRSLFRRPPVRIPSIFYGFLGEGVSYGITKRAVRQIGFRVNDGTDIRFAEGTRETPNFKHGKGEAWQPDERMYVQLYPNDWLAYDLTAEESSESSVFGLSLRLRVPAGTGKIAVALNGTEIGSVGTNTNQWETVSLQKQFHLVPGLNKIILKAQENPVCVEWLEIFD